MIFNALILSVLLFSGNPFTLDAEPETEHNLSFPLGRNWQCVISPGSDLYPRYIADPIRPGIALTRLNVSDSEILTPATPRKRINYTRQELVCGVNLAALTHWRLYGEAGYGWELRNEYLQEPWRVKGGLEFEDTNLFWKGQAGYYAAIDVTATEELNWQKDLTIQVGFVLSAAKLTRTYRLGVEYRDGRSVMGEFFQHHETYFAFGLWIEL